MERVKAGGLPKVKVWCFHADQEGVILIFECVSLVQKEDSPCAGQLLRVCYLNYFDNNSFLTCVRTPNLNFK